MAKLSLTDSLVRVNVTFKKKNAALMLIAAIVIFIVSILIISSLFSEDIASLLRASARFLGVSYIPVFALIAATYLLIKFSDTKAQKLKRILGGVSVTIVLITVLAFIDISTGILGFLTDDGSVSLGGTLGDTIKGNVLQGTIIIIVFSLAAFLLIAPDQTTAKVKRLTLDFAVLLSNLRIVDRRKQNNSAYHQPSLPRGRLPDEAKCGINWKLPKFDFYTGDTSSALRQEQIEDTCKRIETKLCDIGIYVEVHPEDVLVGPTVSLFAIRPVTGVRVNEIIARERDLEMELGKEVRFPEEVQVQGTVGLEVPNPDQTIVNLGNLLSSQEFIASKAKMALPIPIGLDTTGKPVFDDLTDLPHLLIAGVTGSGKSVCLNTFITSLLLLNDPCNLQLVLIDPKRVEFSMFQDVPHLVNNKSVGNIITETDEASDILASVTSLINKRTGELRDAGVRNITSYNDIPGKHMSYLVVVVDELASLIPRNKNITRSLTEIGRLGRAVGIHGIIATQRPSRGVIDMDVQGQFPGRIAFNVTTSSNSVMILNHGGAEKLIGKGDMLFQSESEQSRRVQGIYIKDEEIEMVTSYWRNHPQTELENDDETRADI